MLLPMLSYADSALFAIFCGLSAHAFLNRYEPTKPLPLITILLVLPNIPTIFLQQYIKSTFLTILFSSGLFYLALSTSAVLYRLSPLHPLYGYPGPWIAKVTSLHATWASATGKPFVVLRELHEKYGDYVRIGPSDISVRDKDAIPCILGTDGMGKGFIYDSRQRYGTPKSTIGIRGIKEHMARRKAWNKGLSTSSIKEFEPRVITRATQLMKRLEGLCDADQGRGVEVVISDWMSYFATDFMGDLAFGGGFEMIRDGADTAGFWELIEKSVATPCFTQHFRQLGPYIQWATALGLLKLRKLGHAIAKKRYSAPGEYIDMMHYFLDEGGPDPEPMPFEQVIPETFLLMIAGSDTTATVLTTACYYLTTRPEVFKRLREEIDERFPPHEASDPVDSSILANMPYLNAVINEALRMYPPVMTYLQRSPEAGSGGKMIGDRFVPESVGVYVSPYVLHHEPRYFGQDVDDFDPDRWLRTKEGESAVAHDAFIPFSTGPMNCAGKALAYVEMRIVLYMFVQKFDLHVKEGWDAECWGDGIKDWFVVEKPKLPVRLRVRKV